MNKLAVAFIVLMSMVCSVMAQTPSKPNIIMILTDDQTTEQFSFMPFLRAVAKLHGREVRHYYHTLSWCCPSRTSILTGMYAHNHQVLSNVGPVGGYPKYMEELLAAKSWPVLLQSGGYYTAMIGKFLNDYPEGSVEIPSGWDRWWTLYAPKFYSFNYNANDDGVVVHYGSGDVNYNTNVMRDIALQVLDDRLPAGQQVAMLIAPTCPHTPATPSSIYAGLYADEPYTIGNKPNFNPPDTAMAASNVPAFAQAIPLLSQSEIDEQIYFWRLGLECLRSVDDMFAAIWKKLVDLNQLANTFIFITTDNGYLRGERRITDKRVAYRESVDSTLYVWGPGVVTGVDAVKIASNIDFMPTFAEIAGLAIPEWVDGRSLLPLLQNPATQWRHSILLRGAGEMTLLGVARFQFWAYATHNYQYTLYPLTTPPSCEYYQQSDTYQMRNICGTIGVARNTAIKARIDALKSCAGETCRDAEDLDPP